ncbi:alpha/beta hydrolase [Sphaerisporangium rufum]|uniref:Alpha/beta hydrolase n=1 Tax=Sphaerisporangium rufum TaxID=1381558 RepID=A0A919V2H2_9ACTN|nr:hypothetical protein [Sphaerisporangium rufum]GII78958.1 alpha/beta hydrolase [Sphaerisporangium rufum]
MTTIRNIVLVPEGLADGSAWRGVHDELTRDGFRVHIVLNPALSPQDDVAVTRRVLDGLDGPAVLAGHGHGGLVISAAGAHPSVASLVYVAAFLAGLPARCGVDALDGPLTAPVRRHKPVWYLVATEDLIIPPPVQHMMAQHAGAKVVEVIGDHAVHVSQPAAVAHLLREAAA